MQTRSSTKLLPLLPPPVLEKRIPVKVLVKNIETNEQVHIEQEMPLIKSTDGIEGIDLDRIVKYTMDCYSLNPAFDVQVDYWSNSLQAFLTTGTFSTVTPAEINLLPTEDLLVNEDGKPCLVLRFKNCTGNVIDLQSASHHVSHQDFSKGAITLHIDPKFKNQRSRTVAQAIEMVIRQRTVSQGYYDVRLRRLVKGMTLDLAAKHVEMRHRSVTGVN